MRVDLRLRFGVDLDDPTMTDRERAEAVMWWRCFRVPELHHLGALTQRGTLRGA